jgi:hypothetical protein
MFGKKFSDLPTITFIQDISAIEPVDFATTLSEIVQRQKERL